MTVGDEVAEVLELDGGIERGIGTGGLELGVRGYGTSEGCVSRKYDIEGDTARRFADVGYGSYRSSNLRLFERTALVVGGGVYRH